MSRHVYICFVQVATLHGSVTSKQRAVEALNKLQLEEEVLHNTTSGYVVATEAPEDVKAQRCRGGPLSTYVGEITVVR